MAIMATRPAAVASRATGRAAISEPFRRRPTSRGGSRSSILDDDSAPAGKHISAHGAVIVPGPVLIDPAQAAGSVVLFGVAVDQLGIGVISRMNAARLTRPNGCAQDGDAAEQGKGRLAHGLFAFLALGI